MKLSVGGNVIFSIGGEEKKGVIVELSSDKLSAYVEYEGSFYDSKSKHRVWIPYFLLKENK